MRHWGQKSWLVLLLAGLFLLPGAVAQTAPPTPQSAPKAATTATAQPKPHARRRKAAPEPEAPVTPAPPPTLAESSPTPPQVSYGNGQLTIVAQNATLSQVLRSVGSLTGTSVEMPSSASGERVVGQLGPGQPRDVLNALLNGTKFNYIILGVTGNPGAVQKVILTTPKPATAVNTAQNAPAVQPPEEPQEVEENYGEPESQPGPQTPIPPQFRHRPGMPPGQPGAFTPAQPQVQPQPQPADTSGDNSQFNGGKTPEQLLQELQQMQQQQQQMQDQLNPANRQPQPQQ